MSRGLEALLKKENREKVQQNFQREKKEWKYFAVVLWFSAQPHEHMFLQKKVLLSLKQCFVICKMFLQPESFTVYTEQGRISLQNFNGHIPWQ